MKGQISSLDLHYLLKEFDVLRGAKVQKVYQDGEDFLFDFYSSDAGRLQLRIYLPNYIFFTKYKPEFPKTPPKFCMFLRKRLSNFILTELRQAGFDRILEFVFEKNDQKYILIVELFSKGNVILCDQDYKIIYPMKPQSWQARTIRGGVKYEYPPKQVETSKLGKDKFASRLKESKMESAVKSLAVDFGLGGNYAEEACERAGVDKDEPMREISDADAGELHSAVKSLFSENIDPHVYDKIISPFKLEKKDDGKKFERFNEAIDETVSRELYSDRKEEKKDLKEEKLDKIRNVLEQQEKTIEKLERDEVENKRKAELLFEKYQLVTQLMDEFKRDMNNMSWDEIKEKYKGHKVLKQVNEKEGIIVLEL